MSDTAAAAADVIKYRGVRKRKWGKYVSEIRLPNSRERIWLGSYDAAEKAARAFDAALFCVRGAAAKFNFPDDPPDIAGGNTLSPPEIQTVAQRYGNSYGGGRQQQATAADEFRARAFEDVTAASSDFDRAGPVDLIDGSFWEMVDMNGLNAGRFSDFGPFLESGEMYVHPYYETRVYEEDDECYDHGLWNF